MTEEVTEEVKKTQKIEKITEIEIEVLRDFVDIGFFFRKGQKLKFDFKKYGDYFLIKKKQGYINIC